jgi:hypothetical protein
VFNCYFGKFKASNFKEFKRFKKSGKKKELIKERVYIWLYVNTETSICLFS